MIGVESDAFWISYLGWIVYVGFGAICTVAELVRPARKLRYRKAVPLDVVAFAAYQLAMLPAAAWVTDPVLGLVRYAPLSALSGVWLPLRVVMFFLVADFGSYWMHRLMHTRHVWRVHRWHHSSTQVYWLSGVRTTIPQQILFNVSYVVAVPLLVGAPAWIGPALIVQGVVQNHWMHMNVSWRSSWIERVIVTPRYHHIHHSADAELHDGNYGAVFSIWDRLFGTYVDPEVTKPKQFGTGENKRDPVLLMIGI
jgi:sterol desaturase/sphingolipid hydroxylase (fatty acid hydroxylase superfamily)